jgi:hypothetical protein
MLGYEATNEFISNARQSSERNDQDRIDSITAGIALRPEESS